MKKNDIQKLAKKTPVDLRKDLKTAREELRALEFDLAAGKVKNISRATADRRKIARILTFLGQKAKETADARDK